MGRIKVLQITHDLEFGGLQQVVVNLCRGMDRERYDIAVLSLAKKGPLATTLEEMDIAVDSLNVTAPDYLTVPKLAGYLRRHSCNIIHTHNTQPLIEGGLAALLSVPNIPVVHTDHSRVFPVRKKYLVAESLISRHTKKVVAVSRSTANDLVQKVGFAEPKVMVIHNGIEVEKFTNARKEYGIVERWSSGEKVIGFIGRLVKGKGVQYLLKAVAELLKEGYKVRLVVVGEGDYQQELHDISKELGIIEKVEFTGARQDVERFYAIFDVFVLPSLSEGLPVVVLEAMASGCPVVVTDVGGTREVVRDGHSGLVIEAEQLPPLTSSLRTILSDDNFARTLAANGLSAARAGFSIEAMSTAYDALYHSVVRS